MKAKILFPFILFILASLLVKPAGAQETFNESAELIVMIPDADRNRNLESIKTALLELGGIEFVGFCSSQRCLYLRIDRNVHQNDQMVIDTLIGLGYQLEVKQSATIQQAQADCKDRF